LDYLLDDVARALKRAYGGRSSVSAVIRAMIEHHEDELKRAIADPRSVPWLVKPKPKKPK